MHAKKVITKRRLKYSLLVEMEQIRSCMVDNSQFVLLGSVILIVCYDLAPCTNNPILMDPELDERKENSDH